MRLLSDAAEYALRAIVWLAQNPDRPYKVREIADGTKTPPGYLIKMLQSLAKAEILAVRRGNRGGFVLRRDPASLTVLEVISAVDPLERIHSCPLGLPSHGTHLCPMHRRIDEAIVTIQNSFARSTIHELITEPTRSRPLCEGLTTGMSDRPA